MGPPADRRGLRLIELRGTTALAGREARRVVTLWTQTILPPVVTAGLLLAIFGGALGGRLRQVEAVDYLSFILPGLLVMTVAGQSFANSATSLFQARNEGYIEDVLTSPLRHWQVALSYMSGGLLRGWLAAAVVAAIALPFTDGVRRPVVAAAGLCLAGVIFSALGVLTGVWAETFDQHAFVANLVITPLALVAGVFYSVDALPEPWSTLTRLDPIFYLVDATRAGFTDVHEAPVAASLLVAVGVATAVVAAAVGVLASGWRLKP
ncbi:MAG: ABC transporter permease [Thermoleophilia bacterium]|nr:ABC transporter permease [Thermoleophilia bacterium]